MASDTLNQTPYTKDGQKRSPSQTFSKTEVQINPKHWAPFGCPAYVLVGELQNQKLIYNKWEYRSKVGIYLGRSPSYGKGIALILNQDTGLVSPQFHVQLEPTFRSIDPNLGQQWIAKAGLDARASSGRKVEHPKRKRQAKGGPLREGASAGKKLAVQGNKPEDKNVEITLEANIDISTDLEVIDQPSNEAGIQTKHTMPDSNDNSMSESGRLVGAEPARPTDTNKETGKQTVESTLLKDNRLDDRTQEIYALTTMFDRSVTEYQNEDPLKIDTHIIIITSTFQNSEIPKKT